MNLLPAILIGGPPHSGKSVLSYSLSQALRARKRPHYLLRAAPDGEGDWSQEIPESALPAIRFKGQWTDYWVRAVSRDIAARPLPLLVDVGGKPSPEQLVMFDQCTGAVLLTPNASERERWRALVQSRGLPVIADLHSDLQGENSLLPNAENNDAAIVGTLAHLQRGDKARATGPAFDALVDRIADIFNFHDDALRRAHLATTPAEAELVDFGSLAERLYPTDPQHRFVQGDLDAILAQVPDNIPIAAYGRVSSWLATALGAQRNLGWQFDARRGWLKTPRFSMAAERDDAYKDNSWFEFDLVPQVDDRRQLNVRLRESYINYEALNGLGVPYVPNRAHLVISGKLPLWAFAAFGQVYRHCAGVTADQPQSTGLSAR